MKKHYVEFMSPGTLFTESTSKEIDSWDVDKAKEMAHNIHERHGARPFGFRFFTRERGENDLDSKITERSGTYYLGGTIRTIEEVRAANNPDERILLSNMEANGYNKIIENRNSWRFTGAFTEDDTLLDFKFKDK